MYDVSAFFTVGHGQESFHIIAKAVPFDRKRRAQEVSWSRSIISAQFYLYNICACTIFNVRIGHMIRWVYFFSGNMRCNVLTEVGNKVFNSCSTRAEHPLLTSIFSSSSLFQFRNCADALSLLSLFLSSSSRQDQVINLRLWPCYK